MSLTKTIVVFDKKEQAPAIRKLLGKYGFRFFAEVEKPVSWTIYSDGTVYENGGKCVSSGNETITAAIVGSKVTEDFIARLPSAKKPEPPVTEMTVAQIEKALGISNLKIVK